MAHMVVQDLPAETADRCLRLAAQHFQLALRFFAHHHLYGAVPFDGVSGSVAHPLPDPYCIPIEFSV